jgi:prepilin-type processing-associated H-X9-DG protein
MNLRLWSFRTFAALWGVLLAPLVPSLADTGDIAELLPADTLAYIGWVEPYDEHDPDLQQAKQFAAQAAEAEFSDPQLGTVAKLVQLGVRAVQAPGGIALLDVQLGEEGPDVQAALLLAAGDDSSKIAETFHQFMHGILPDSEISERSVAGVPMHSMPLADSPFSLVWGTHKGYFLLTLGPAAAEKMLGRLSGTSGPSLADSDELKFLRKKVGATDGKYRFSAYGDVRGIVAKAKSLAEQMTGPLPPLADKVIEALGINAIRSKYLHVRDSEQGALTRIFVHVEGERKGILKLWDQKPLSEDDLKIIPKDAYWAQVWNLDLNKLWADTRGTVEEIDPNMLPMVEGALAMAGGFLGFSVTDDLLPAFGDTWALFDARTHGGILLTGSVLVADVRDADAIHGLFAHLVEMLAPMLAAKEVNLSLRETTRDGHTIHYVVVGGIPCPVTPAWAFVDNRMVFGLFPQTVAVAANQVDPKTRRESILDQPAVSSALQSIFPSEIQSFGYADAQYFARLFYPFGLLYATAGTSMFSVPGVELDPTIFPILADAVKDVQSSVGVSATDEDGIHYAQVGAANAGLAAVAGVALAMSILLPSLSRARELAKRAVSASNLRGIGQGCHIYANDQDGKFPESLDALIDAGMVIRGMLNSPRDHEGNISYVYISGQTVKEDPRNILAFERLIGDEGTNVLFLDGHVQWMKLDQFKQALLKTYQRLGREDELPADLRDLQP